ncbi:MAG: rod shape-determining protein MreC [bacterium]
MFIKKKSVASNTMRIRTGIIILVFLVLLFLIPSTRKGIRYTIEIIATPFVYMTHGLGNWSYSQLQTLRFKSSLVAENKNLNNEIVNLNAKFSNYDELAQENINLKSILGRASGKQFILAVVLTKPPVSLYDTLLIDGGSSAGIISGATVYVNGNVPIGTVSQVFSHSAVVQLYSAPSQKMDARLDPAGIDVTLFGHGGGNFLISVPHDMTVPENSTVVSKEINPHVLGNLQKVISDPRDSSQTLIFSSPINFNELNFVEIEK